MKNYLKPGTLPSLQKLAKALGKDLVFVDLEATGFVNDPKFAIIETGIVMVGEKGILEESSLLDPEMRIPSNITALTGITNEMVKGKPTFKQRYLNFFEKSAKDYILVGFNSKAYDSKGIEKVGRQNGKDFKFENQLDVRYIFARERNETKGTSGTGGTLTDAKRNYKIHIDGDAHRAGYDIALTAVVLEVILQKHGIGYIQKEVEKFACKKTIAKFKSNFTEDCTSVSSLKSGTKKTANPIKESVIKKLTVTNSKLVKDTKSSKTAPKSVKTTTKDFSGKKTSSIQQKTKKIDENDVYRKKYLEEKKANSGIVGKIFGSLFD